MTQTNNISALNISGPDAEKFLQGQLTCNILNLTENTPQFCALCNRKGRVIASFNIIKKDLNYYLILSEPMIEIVLKTLKKYARFSKVILQLDYIEGAYISPAPEITPENSGLYTPHKLNYHLLDGVIDFKKGCYTGQEIIARTQYLGKNKGEKK